LIALDTIALLRLLVEDDEIQALTVKNTIEAVEKKGQQIIILTEVLIETVWVLESVYECTREDIYRVWVLESVYECTREDIYRFLETLTYTSVFTFSEPQIIANAIRHFKKGGDFADLIKKC
jgi:predicted nucleic-acid-binding protein